MLLAVVLVGGTLALPYLAMPGAGYGERVYAANPVLVPTDPAFAAYRDQTLAQSFTANDTYVLLNVTLRLRNLGNVQNALTVAIQTNNPVSNVPSSTVLSSVNVAQPPGSLAYFSIPLSPAPTLYAGNVYWIVISNSAPQPTFGYEWHYANIDAYPGGHAETYNVTSGSWVAYLSYDMDFVVYGRGLSANVTAGLSADRARALPTDSVVFTVFLNNTGTQVAPVVWANLTWPSGLTFVTDTSTQSPFVSTTAFPSYTFSNVSNGVHSFTVTGQVDIGVQPGTVVTAVASAAFSNATGVVRSGPAASASVTIGLETKQLYLGYTPTAPNRILTATAAGGSSATLFTVGRGQTFDWPQSPPLALPFQVLNVTATLWLTSQSQKAQTLVFDLSLMDSNGSVATQSQTTVAYAFTGSVPHAYTFSFPSLHYTFPSGHRIQLRVAMDPTGTDGVQLSYNSTGQPAHLDLLTTTYVSVDAVTLVNPAGAAAAFTPLDAISVQANVSDPFGPSHVSAVYLNITSAIGGNLVTAARMVAIRNDTGPTPAWALYARSLGTGVPNGTYAVVVTAIEDNGVADLARTSLIVRAPGFLFTKIASVERAKAGDRFTYFLWFNNTGTGAASRVWINDTLPSQLNLVSASWAGRGTYLGQTPIAGGYSFAWASVPAGSTDCLRLDVSVGGTVNQVAWIRNDAILAFQDENGHSWPSLSSSADVVINGPNVNVGLASSPATAVHTNETVTYTITLSNSGDTAQTLWLNATLPAGLAYVNDTAWTLGGTSTVVGNQVSIVLHLLTAGNGWTINLIAQAAPALARGAVLTTVVTLDTTSLNAVLMPRQTASEGLVVASPFIGSAGLTLGVTQASPGEVVPVTLRFTDAGNEPASFLWANVTVNPLLVYVDSSVPATVDASGPDLLLFFSLSNVSLGSHAIYMNFTVDLSAPGRQVVDLNGTIAYADEYLNLLPVVAVPSVGFLVVAPAMTLSLTPLDAVMEPATYLNYSLYVFNSGAGTASDVWLNLTLPSALEYVQDSSGLPVYVLGADYSWHWVDQGPGTRSFTLSLFARPSSADGTSSNVTFRVDYMDLNHVPRPEVSLTTHVAFIAPTIALSVSADRTASLPGGVVTFTLVIRNAGNTTAHWVSIQNGSDPSLKNLWYISTVPAVPNSEYSWNYSDLAPGQSQVIILGAKVKDGTPAQTVITEAFQAFYSNSHGGPGLIVVRSAPLQIRVDADFMPLLYIGLGGVVLAPLLGFIVSRKSRVQIEEAFLVYRDGVLISHLSRTLLQDKDEDVLSGMLTAVQEFVRDAFQYGAHRELHQMDFGEYRILIERGDLAYLAVVYSGKSAGSIRRKVRDVLNRIEETYRDVLEKWDGDMEKVVGARDMIREYLLGAKANGKNRNHLEAQ